ncbi:MAG TPA: S8 family serine peptidase, partial [Thermomicrobiales bacterium]|nr:S8 family serine peptidase [Thermomicrobiales bacterium]
MKRGFDTWGFQGAVFRRVFGLVAFGALAVALVLTQIGFSAISTSWIAAPDVAAQTPSEQTAPLPDAGSVIVVLKPQSGFRTASVAASNDITPTAVYGAAIDGFAADLSDTQIADLSKNPDVAYIVPNIPFQAAAQTLSTAVVRSGLDQSPLVGIDGGGTPVNVDIAIVDTGINLNSSDLDVVGGVNCMTGNPVESGYADDNGHGSHVAGIAAARDDGSGVVGSAPGARLWAVKVLDNNGNGTLDSVLCGLDWVAANMPQNSVVNMSLTATGGDSTCTTGNDALHTAVCSITSEGIPVVVAAGNGTGNNSVGTSTSPIIPAMYPEVISVAAINDYNGQPGGGAATTCTNSWGPDDTLATYSNYGALADIAAPGTCIQSDWKDGSLQYDSGTSMASPLVAGIAADYKAQNPGASAATVQSWLLSSAASQPMSSSVGYSGHNGGPILYLGGTNATYPTGDVNPAFAGAKATIVTSIGSSNGSGSGRVWDNDTNT